VLARNIGPGAAGGSGGTDPNGCGKRKFAALMPGQEYDAFSGHEQQLMQQHLQQQQQQNQQQQQHYCAQAGFRV